MIIINYDSPLIDLTVFELSVEVKDWLENHCFKYETMIHYDFDNSRNQPISDGWKLVFGSPADEMLFKLTWM